MKKLSMILLIASAAVGVGFFIYQTLIPQSDKLLEQYKAFTATIDQARYQNNAGYRWEVDEELRTRQVALASAYNADKRPDEAIVLLESLIAEMNKQQYVLNKRIRRNSGQVELVAIYYQRLADSYGLKHDEKKKEWALQKSDEYKAEADLLEKRGN